MPLASVVITNHNYGRFLGAAIDSALGQSYPGVEVIVVDDGSTDESRTVLERYGDHVRSLYQEQMGQLAATNIGFAASHGELVIFLDADDILLPSAVATASRILDDQRVTKMHWPMQWVDPEGHALDDPPAPTDLPRGDLRDALLADGPGAVLAPPTSGNAWARSFLERVLPAPSTHTYIDNYLAALAPLYGRIDADPDVHTLYRLHPDSHHISIGWKSRLAAYLHDVDVMFETVAQHARALGLPFDSREWTSRSYLHRLRDTVDEIAAVLPPKAPFALLDDAEWDIDILDGRRAVPFPERDGVWWGPAIDDADAVRALDDVTTRGIQHVVVGWPAFWWLDHYKRLAHTLNERFDVVHENDRVMIFRAR